MFAPAKYILVFRVNPRAVSMSTDSSGVSGHCPSARSSSAEGSLKVKEKTILYSSNNVEWIQLSDLVEFLSCKRAGK